MFSLMSMLEDKKLFLESRLRESFHVLRLSNRLCRLRHTVQPSLPWVFGAIRRKQWQQRFWHQTCWTSADVPGSLAAAAGRKRWLQSDCQLAFLPGCQVDTCPSHGPERACRGLHALLIISTDKNGVGYYMKP